MKRFFPYLSNLNISIDTSISVLLPLRHVYDFDLWCQNFQMMCKSCSGYSMYHYRRGNGDTLLLSLSGAMAITTSSGISLMDLLD